MGIRSSAGEEEIDRLTIRVNSRDNVVVILVNQRLNSRIRSILREQLPRKVLSRHRGNPFTRMHSAMNKHRGLRALTARAPNMDTCQRTTLNRCSSREKLGLASEASLEVTQEREVVGIGVVGREPSLGRDFNV